MQRHITPTTPLFLLNIESRQVLGVFFAEGRVAMDIVPEAWKQTGNGRSFPAQIRVRRGPVVYKATPTKPKVRTGPCDTQETAELLVALGISVDQLVG